MKQSLLLLLILASAMISCTRKQPDAVRDDFKTFYDRYHVEGSFVLYDPQADTYTFYNPEQFRQPFTPASTFKICNALIGLETGVIRDENFVIPWDSVVRNRPAWNCDHDLKSAFRNSTVWYYQELARRVGGSRMKYWLDKAQYGNADTSGGIDQFWLAGALRISPEQQITFLRRLHDNQLPFSQRSMDIVKNIMITKDTLDYVVRAKTGWGVQDAMDLGWFVGYLETHGKVYYFANCIQSADSNNKDFADARTDIVFLILDALGLMPISS
ncbi:MAG TPA: class D beta-lactamase [Bacteroidales bacterium]|nr:class D beta-lactamase [Bacteroidales bacterium]